MLSGWRIVKISDCNSEVYNLFPNSSFEIGDEFQIGGRSVPEAADFSVYSEQSYWVVTDASKNVNEWNQELPPETDGAS